MAKPEPGLELAVEIALSEEERREIFRFRYQVLVRDMAWGSADADHERETLSDPLDEGALQLFVRWQGIVIGTVRAVVDARRWLPEPLVRAQALDRFADFSGRALSFTDHLMVAPAWQSSQVTALLLGAAYKTVRGRGSRFDFMHCPLGLVELYEQLGYRRYAGNFDSADGYRVPLVLLTEDMSHLQAIGSPFAPLAAVSGGHEPETLSWFMREFPEHAARPCERAMDEDRFWNFLTERLHQTPLVGIPLLSGLSYAEATRFLKVGTVLTCMDGDAIVRAGEEGREMFVVLSGRVHVVAPGSGRVIATLGRGAVFGEMALLAAEPRSADIVAQGNVELLVLTESLLHEAMATMPAVSAKLLFALSVILCKRLRGANRRWLGTAEAGELDEGTEAEAALGPLAL